LHQKLGKLIPDQSKLLQTAADGKAASAASKITGFVGESHRLKMTLALVLHTDEYFHQLKYVLHILITQLVL